MILLNSRGLPAVVDNSVTHASGPTLRRQHTREDSRQQAARDDRTRRPHRLTEARPQPPAAPARCAPRSPRPPRSHAGPTSPGTRSRSRSASADARSGAARWCTAMSTCAGPGPLGHDLLQAGDRLRRRPHLLQHLDAPAVQLQQRLHGERRAQQCLRGADPAAAAQIVQGVDVEVRGRARGPLLGRRRPPRPPCRPPPPPRAAASAQNPRAMATMPVSTTRTGTGASCAASTAASYVPENSADRCRETMPVAPASADLAVGLRRRPRGWAARWSPSAASAAPGPGSGPRSRCPLPAPGRPGPRSAAPR